VLSGLGIADNKIYLTHKLYERWINKLPESFDFTQGELYEDITLDFLGM